MVQISNAAGDSYYEDLTAESFDALLDKLVAGETPGRKKKPKGETTPMAARPPRSTTVKPKAAAKSKPKVLYTDGPTDGEPDDLKKIKGIGPKFEGDLNSKGIYYFRQIGAWKAADIKMVEGVIDSFPGRIKRDEWVKQGKALAKSAEKKG